MISKNRSMIIELQWAWDKNDVPIPPTTFRWDSVREVHSVSIRISHDEQQMTTVEKLFMEQMDKLSIFDDLVLPAEQDRVLKRNELLDLKKHAVLLVVRRVDLRSES